MKISRRELVSGAGVLLVGGIGSGRARADAAPTAAEARVTAGADSYVPVRTPNGWTLPYRLVDGVKEFHLVAEEIEHEFAPGCKAKCWGYNGSTPGPTLEAVEGDRVRIFVTNRLKEHTSMHWHGILLPNGMDGVGGLTQPQIDPGETYVYEFTLQQHGTHMYHPHADEMVQMAVGMMGLFVIHPKDGEPERIDRDYAILLHNWALHPGTYRPDPSVLLDFDLWTFNSKVFPAIDNLVARTGERVRIRFGNLSMWNHPIHMHGVQFEVTGSDGGRWPRPLWRREVTELVGRRPDARPRVRRGARRLGAPLPHGAPHHERHGARHPERARRRPVRGGGARARAAAGLHGDGQGRHGRAPGAHRNGPPCRPREHAADDDGQGSRTGISRWAACSP
jgi:FtsP/CotA-like multicopper oxidase with cupredoxin domain